MSAPVRIGAVGYLNARPLTWALDARPERWAIRYDLPSVCSSLLHAGQVDLGLVPSIDYLQDPDYRFVPGVGIGSRGPVASVALFTRVPVERIAVDRARYEFAHVGHAHSRAVPPSIRHRAGVRRARSRPARDG